MRVFRILAALICAGALRAQPGSAVDLTDRFLASQSFPEQLEIGQQLVALRDVSVLQRIQPLLTEEDRHRRGNGALVLGGLGDAQGFNVIVAILNDRSARAPGQLGARWSLPEQIREDRYYSVHLLGMLKDPRAVPVLRAYWGDPDVNYKIPWALGEIGGAEAIEELVLALDNPSADVYAIESLVKLKAAQALPKLRGMLDDIESNHAGDITTVGSAARRAIAAIEAKQ
jgi:HEAT repeat protein